MEPSYDLQNAALPAKFMTSQSAGNLLATRPQVVNPSGNTVDSFMTRFVVAECSVNNRSASDATIGLGVLLDTSIWQAGQWTDATTTYVDDTTDAQDAGSDDFALGTTSTNNDGFVVLCQIPFNIVSVIVSTAASGGVPAWDLAYSVAGGSWSTITNPFVAPAFGSTSEQIIWFQKPLDWAVTEAGHGTDIPTGQYAIRVRETTAGSSSAGLATNLVVGSMVYNTEGIGDNKVFLVTKEGETQLPPQGIGLCVAISNLNIQNRATVKYRMRG